MSEDIVEKYIQEDLSSKLRSFSSLLEDIKSLDDKKRRLWQEIYEYALTDRQNAYRCFSSLIDMCNEKTHEWAIHGKTITSYIERMNKANDQLIKLATLISAEQAKEENVNMQDLYSQIQEK
jgi:hypothetical protein